jgi:thiol-disulfide isomerase/thioredoxin
MPAALLLGLFFFAAPLEAGLEFEDLSGAREKIEVAAAPLVVHFWATWCESCAEELPALAREAEACDGSAVRVVLANAGEDAADARGMSERLGVTARVRVDPKGELWRRSGARGLPASWIWDGRRARLIEGAKSVAEWRELLGNLGCLAGAGAQR